VREQGRVVQEYYAVLATPASLVATPPQVRAKVLVDDLGSEERQLVILMAIQRYKVTLMTRCAALLP